MSRTHLVTIKICGIQYPEMAVKAIASGAHWIGMVFSKRSRRAVNLETAKEISNAVFEAGGVPVGVFENAASEEILTVCEKTGIRMIQVHGIQAIQASEYLPIDYQRIYALSADTFCQNMEFGFPDRDFILFDGPCAGSGEKFNWSNFSYEGSYRWILAGGLTAGTVALGVRSLNPFGVDVSSGVENEKGEKTMKKINEFIRAVI